MKLLLLLGAVHLCVCLTFAWAFREIQVEQQFTTDLKIGERGDEGFIHFGTKSTSYTSTIPNVITVYFLAGLIIISFFGVVEMRKPSRLTPPTLGQPPAAHK